MNNIFEEKESEVRSYCRHFPKVFERAYMDEQYTVDNEKYLDFFSGAGALNYGHNNEVIMKDIVDYIGKHGVMHSLDMYTKAKQEFIQVFDDMILKPRDLNYKMMFCGPTGTNANEAALKLVRKYTKRNTVFSFMGAFHGMTLGSLSLTSSAKFRAGGGVSLNNVTFIPYCGMINDTFDSINYMEQIITDNHSGIEKPAAIFVETIQAEGGVFIADVTWLQRLQAFCRKHDILMVCDEVQVGCGRTGTFFSFERAGIQPDIVTLSKSISGCGLPMSLLLMKPELDCFSPGEHNGTFRGNQLAFVGAKAAIQYGCGINLWKQAKEKGEYIYEYVSNYILPIDSGIKARGLGMIQGIDFEATGIKEIGLKVTEKCFKNNLIIETSGRNGNVVKIMPPLTINYDNLKIGLDILQNSIQEVLQQKARK